MNPDIGHCPSGVAGWNPDGQIIDVSFLDLRWYRT